MLNLHGRHTCKAATARRDALHALRLSASIIMYPVNSHTAAGGCCVVHMLVSHSMRCPSVQSCKQPAEMRAGGCPVTSTVCNTDSCYTTNRRKQQSSDIALPPANAFDANGELAALSNQTIAASIMYQLLHTAGQPRYLPSARTLSSAQHGRPRPSLAARLTVCAPWWSA